MVYKTLKKVSEYCQLVDKRNFPATQTIKGVTFTNNNDGSITIDGTNTSSSTALNEIRTQQEFQKNHIYFMTGITGGSDTTYRFMINGLLYVYEPTIFKYSKNDKSFDIYINVPSGCIVSNITVKPQLFDLTEMYGAGNEPTTVEEFRTKFPNELYDYKPYCFVKSYKTLLKAADDKIITSYKKSLKVTDSILL